MKKINICLIVILCLALSGCATQEADDSPKEIANITYEAETRVEDLQYGLRDDDFWMSTYRSANLIEKTLDEWAVASISVKLKPSKGKTIILEDFYKTILVDSDDPWRKLAINQIIYALATSEEVTKAERIGKSLTVSSVILTWTSSENGVSKTASLCDTENDGKWDFVSRGSMCFVENDFANVAPADESGYGIGVIHAKNPRILEVEGNAQLSEFSIAVLG